MDRATTLEQIISASVEDRLWLVEEIWNSIAEEEQVAELSPAQREELDRRIAASDAAPDDAIPWDEIKSAALARTRA